MEYKFKVVVVGSSGVGKTSIVERLINGKFDNDQISTTGADYSHYTTIVNEKQVKLQIWDTAGQERYRAISKSYFRNAVGVLLVYDITSLDSFDELMQWLNDIQTLCSPNSYVLLVGNKSDLESQRKVSPNQVEQFATSNHLESIVTSAQSGDNVKNAFEKLASELYTRQINGQFTAPGENAPELIDTTNSNNSYCSC
ncbi:small GTP-binding protein, putative [Trichomonas vaginalis G3]|uniref:Small GTP-binding protein, putative n=1 Tax=Trichomonas vaginalis (strain ATCC PRA-98 / G3) TaxID=412133 RepID=A2G473_TRIV3|nr:regulation of endocytosis [Trichomonas vaginalis G3]EAX88045.1 small GTP-binding protein, putative [Trichomonas vaginalis G3]KAI5497941.1 regulation of endocytosis [Trichomonas vaginalis G3]|eukprot:XP_001300975.1 small GTP-binding protein [Trichomonas vaginalis G3]